MKVALNLFESSRRIAADANIKEQIACAANCLGIVRQALGQLELAEQMYREAQTLATLTGWNIGETRKAMNLGVRPVNDQKKWYERLWSD